MIREFLQDFLKSILGLLLFISKRIDASNLSQRKEVPDTDFILTYTRLKVSKADPNSLIWRGIPFDKQTLLKVLGIGNSRSRISKLVMDSLTYLRGSILSDLESAFSLNRVLRMLK